VSKIYLFPRKKSLIKLLMRKLPNALGFPSGFCRRQIFCFKNAFIFLRVIFVEAAMLLVYCHDSVYLLSLERFRLLFGSMSTVLTMYFIVAR
jgi:hypothetical protein